MSWCPSWSNNLWQGGSCGLVHCPAGNTTDPIWRELASSDGISSGTPLKPQHSNPNPNLKPFANQLLCIDFLTPPTPLTIPHRPLAFHESLMLLKNWFSIHARWTKSSLKNSIRFCGIFQSLKQNFIAYRSSKVSSRPDCIFEIHQLWHQVLVGCIRIPAVAVHLNLKSQKLVSHVYRYIAITYWNFKSLHQF